ncbi:hypothetical protein [Nocardiopsis lambiniae]|uniref:DUF732 domain-containing protein n=1 Tax=Nocardiopsis lambiniae TaxID=3075539 RepID=A0ABU2MG45_9ACTN|nr:hypothetical protein [Nocardiopsis sp. DSM 44743]MDT0331673.1 hypothetical protein [Nocardiopsis sp. DSM 44743]
MNPHREPEQPPWNPPPGPPPGPPPPPPPPRPAGRYGTGLMVVLVVIAVLAGASVLGGGLVLGSVITSGVAAGEAGAEPSPEPTREETPTPEPTPEPEPEPEPTSEPTDEPTPAPEDLPTSDDLVAELRREYDIRERRNITAELCEGSEQEGTLFQCTSATDTEVVRVIAYAQEGSASLAALLLKEGMGEDGNDAVDVQEACHFVLIWFEGSEADQAARDGMAEYAREAAGCA